MSEDLVEGNGFYEGKIQSIVGNNLHISVDIMIRADILKIEGRQPSEFWMMKKISYPVRTIKNFHVGQSVILELYVEREKIKNLSWNSFLQSLSDEWPDIIHYFGECNIYTDFSDFQEEMKVELHINSIYRDDEDFTDTPYYHCRGEITPIIKIPGQQKYKTGYDFISEEKPVFSVGQTLTVRPYSYYRGKNVELYFDTVADYSIPAWNAFIKKYHEGDIVEGDVQKQSKEGLLVDIDNFWTMLPTNEIDYGTYIRPKDLVGQHIKVKILYIYEDLHKVIVSRKQAQNSRSGHSAKKQSHDELQELRERIERLEKEVNELKGQRENLGNTIRKHDGWW